jgi:hypothetical protein
MEIFIKQTIRLTKRNVIITAILLFFIIGLIVWAVQSDNRNSDPITEPKLPRLVENYGVINKVKIPLQIQKPVAKDVNISKLNSNLFSNVFFLRHDDIRQNIIEYCSEHVLKTQNAQMNCNAANKVDNSWYRIYEISSNIIKMACSSKSNFGYFILISLLVFGLVKSFLNLFNPFRYI